MSRIPYQLWAVQERVKLKDTGIVRCNVDFHTVLEYPVDLLVPKIKGDVGRARIKAQLFRKRDLARFLPTPPIGYGHDIISAGRRVYF